MSGSPSGLVFERSNTPGSVCEKGSGAGIGRSVATAWWKRTFKSLHRVVANVSTSASGLYKSHMT
eukprot:5639864-Pyramimonas_sp.AAC.3